MKRNQKHGRCERCGCIFDTADGYAYMNYAHVAANLPLAHNEEFYFGLCCVCEEDFNNWLDKGL